LVSCDDMLNVDTDRTIYEKDYQLQSPNDTIYSMVGIYSQLQKIMDSYILLGEMRGDLLDVTENSNQNLRDINNFNISKSNPYANIKDYYAVINNCNYLIQYIDTAAVINGQKKMYKYYAAAKGIRAWTYMQIAINFGSATFYEKPILSISEANADYPEYTITELANVLIPDLLPLKDIATPSFQSKTMTFPIRFLLGDLYLWTKQYKEAATEYHDLMLLNQYLIQKAYQSYWVLDNNQISENYDGYWGNSFYYGGAEAITTVLCPKTYGQKFELDSLNLKREIAPSKISIDNWDNQTYFNTESNTVPGDLRKTASVIDRNTIISMSHNIIYTTNNPTNTKVENIVYKYLWNTPAENVQTLVIYRASLLYLRYAEAVNRLGKPNLAFAVLKNGLRSTTVASTSVVPLNERSTESYMNFNSFKFDNNVGIRTRGLGPKLGELAVGVGDSLYRIPAQASLPDSVLYVEDLIQKELALETAFEGNRFQDLMRLAIRRNDNAYLAKIVAAKHVGNEAAIEAKLMDQQNWYVKK